jgi:PPP4R2
MAAISAFESAPPFTIQRVAELVLLPNRYHSNKDKYLRALDRALTVRAWPGQYHHANSLGFFHNQRLPPNSFQRLPCGHERRIAHILTHSLGALH